MAGRWYGDWTIDDRIVLPPNPDGRGVSIQVERRLAGIVARIGAATVGIGTEQPSERGAG